MLDGQSSLYPLILEEELNFDVDLSTCQLIVEYVPNLIATNLVCYISSSMLMIFYYIKYSIKKYVKLKYLDSFVIFSTNE